MSIKEALAQNDNLYIENDLYYQKELTRPSPFEALYITLREKENRFYPENLIRNFPEIPINHQLRSEWAVRKKSLDLLIRYLASANSVYQILEVGCGNGWLSNQLVQRLPAEICGIDVNEFELRQAANLFKEQNRLSFIFANVWEQVLPLGAFDVIILASSVQYFPDLKLLIQRLFELSASAGEIHIIDSPFYASTRELERGKKKSSDYFNSMDFPRMADHFFHHTFSSLNDFDFSLMYNPKSASSRFQRKIMRSPLSPFPWIRIKRK